MGVHLRSAFHPLLGRLRIGASRLGPLSPELRTLDCSSACPGSSTWVDKVPSQDTPSLDLADRRGNVNPGDPQVAHTPSLNLAGHQGGVHPDDPQVARNRSATWIACGASVRTPSAKAPAWSRATISTPGCAFSQA